MADQYVCNVQTWGSSPSYHQGDLIPEDCPYDVEAAAESGKLLTVEQYKKQYPDWDPEAQAKAKAEAKAMQAIYPGYDPPTAADMPDPVATKQMYDEAAEVAEGPQGKPTAPAPTVQSQPSSTGKTSTTTSGSTSTTRS